MRTGGSARRRRECLSIHGRVQGVGFRPFVCRLARELALTGHVSNDNAGVYIEAEGSAMRLAEFAARIQTDHPVAARIAGISRRRLDVAGDASFVIMPSRYGGVQGAEIAPDLATCDDCLRELRDADDRRFLYPFINCTNCGPRYSIVHGVPYDRCRTTMSEFAMCPRCRTEYADPDDRRFHAQPDACWSCGPRVQLVDREGRRIDCDPIPRCAAMIRNGAIAAIKGIGGFHVACRADDDAIVNRLRMRKGRESKPFAVMVASLEAARRYAHIDASVAAVLTSPARPIVLLPKRAGSSLSPAITPDSTSVGIMLPYTPLHHLLFCEGLGALVMTSGNRSDEPLCCENAEALERLAAIADVFLLHDRKIARRVDDSIVLAMESSVAPPVVLRRARGYVPTPIRLIAAAPEPVLAVGGEMKSAICVLSGGDAVLSEHLGELSDARAYRNFVRTVDQFQSLLRVQPRVIAHDLHPDHAATRYARKLGLRTIGVQHHHAHIVSCMAENGITGKVIGLACDGTGYGTDGTIWGGEILRCDAADFDRVGQLRYFPLIGGDAAARETWRPASGLLFETFGKTWLDHPATETLSVSREQLRMAATRFDKPERLPRTSSVGRLFDAVACLLGVCARNDHEARAAMSLEALAAGVDNAPVLGYDIIEHDARLLLDPRPLVRDLIEKLRAGMDRAVLARAFHETVVAMLAAGATRAARTANLNRIVLSGGCFANRILLAGTVGRLRASGLCVFVHRDVPPGDGGLALGQAVVAAERLRRTGHVSGGTR